MREEATAKIYSTLSSDLVVETIKDQKRYGLIIVSVKKKIELVDSDDFLNETKHFPVAIWNQELLSTQGHRLRRGAKVLIIGELDIFNVSQDVSNSNKYSNEGVVMIHVNHHDGVKFLEVERSERLLTNVSSMHQQQINQLN